MRHSIISAALLAVSLTGCSAPPSGPVKPSAPATVLKPKDPVLVKEGVKTIQTKQERIPVSPTLSKKDEKAIMAVLNEHLAAYRTKNLKRYMNTLSKTAQGFHYEAEMLHMTQVFARLDRTMELMDARIYKTGDDLKSAAVYARIKVSSAKQKNSAEYETITIFKRDPDGWKMSATINLPVLLDS